MRLPVAVLLLCSHGLGPPSPPAAARAAAEAHRGFFLDEGLYEGSECKLEDDGGPGLCRKVTECPSRLEEILAGKRGPHSAGRCGFDGKIEIVCCPTAIPAKSSPRTADIACEHYQNTVVVVEDVGFHIFAGKTVRDHEFPYMAALGYEVGDKIEYNCGGTLISAEHVLTAAHCVHNRMKRVPVEVQLGALDLEAPENGAQRIPVKQIIRHEEHKQQRLYYDLAIVRLTRRAELSGTVKPICLPSEAERRMLEAQNPELIVVGWGSTDIDAPTSKDLMKTPALRLAERDACAASYTNIVGLQQGLADYMLCVVDRNASRGADACPGDSGGPLLMEHDGARTIVGVTAFGVGCGGTVPGIYTAVYPFLDWIEDVVWRRVVLELINPRSLLFPERNGGDGRTADSGGGNGTGGEVESGAGMIEPRIWE